MQAQEEVKEIQKKLKEVEGAGNVSACISLSTVVYKEEHGTCSIIGVSCM